ncbi:universal stress protein [Streptomyces sp. AGS-58]|uniref:universal stress protein n=1 Tax=unclassified Streptomyces TaxID=2593676 RepID=UPI0035A2942C
MDLPLIVGVDGSDSSPTAVDRAVDEAVRHGLPLHPVPASLREIHEGAKPSFGTDRPAEEVMAEHIVPSCVERAHHRNFRTKDSDEELAQDSVSALLRAGLEGSALVTGSRGRGQIAGILLGYVRLAVAARAVCPVVVVRGAEPNRRGALGRIVVGVGDTTGSAAAVRFAVREAEVRGGALTAVRIWRNPSQEPVDHMPIADDAARLREERAATGLDDALREAVREHPQADVRRQPLEGPAHRILMKASAEDDMIVVFRAQRRHEHFGPQVGGGAQTLLHRSDRPVTVVPQPV